MEKVLHLGLLIVLGANTDIKVMVVRTFEIGY